MRAYNQSENYYLFYPKKKNWAEKEEREIVRSEKKNSNNRNNQA